MKDLVKVVGLILFMVVPAVIVASLFLPTVKHSENIGDLILTIIFIIAGGFAGALIGDHVLYKK